MGHHCSIWWTSFFRSIWWTFVWVIQSVVFYIGQLIESITLKHTVLGKLRVWLLSKVSSALEPLQSWHVSENGHVSWSQQGQCHKTLNRRCHTCKLIVQSLFMVKVQHWSYSWWSLWCAQLLIVMNQSLVFSIGVQMILRFVQMSITNAFVEQA